MQTAVRPKGGVKSIMKAQEQDGGSTKDIEEDSFEDDEEDEEDEKKSSTDTTGVRPSPNKKFNVLQIAGRETRFVLCSKTLAYLVLLLSSVACGVVTYFYIEKQEETAFENDVRSYHFVTFRMEGYGRDNSFLTHSHVSIVCAFGFYLRF